MKHTHDSSRTIVRTVPTLIVYSEYSITPCKERRVTVVCSTRVRFVGWNALSHNNKHTRNGINRPFPVSQICILPIAVMLRLEMYSYLSPLRSHTRSTYIQESSASRHVKGAYVQFYGIELKKISSAAATDIYMIE